MTAVTEFKAMPNLREAGRAGGTRPHHRPETEAGACRLSLADTQAAGTRRADKPPARALGSESDRSRWPAWLTRSILGKSNGRGERRMCDSVSLSCIGTSPEPCEL